MLVTDFTYFIHVVGLMEGVTYEFFVTASNGVSDQENLTPPIPATGTPTDTSVTGIVVGVVVACIAVVSLVIVTIVIAFFL